MPQWRAPPATSPLPDLGDGVLENRQSAHPEAPRHPPPGGPAAAPLLPPSGSPRSRRLGFAGPWCLRAPNEGLAPPAWLAVWCRLPCGKLHRRREGSGRTDRLDNERDGEGGPQVSVCVTGSPCGGCQLARGWGAGCPRGPWSCSQSLRLLSLGARACFLGAFLFFPW